MAGGDSKREELLAELLVQFEQQLAGGSVGAFPDTSAIADDTELLAEWEADRNCLQLLDRVRRHWAPGDATCETPIPKPAHVSTLGDVSTNTTLGRFRILHELGRGGLGIVYLAYDPKLARQVAIKVPRPESLSSTDLRRRFLREAEAAARLNHPYLVSVYEVDEEQAVCFIVAEFCPGPSLAEWIKRRPEPMPLRVAATLVEQLAEAVQHAHTHGVLHRDLKPSNVLLCKPKAEDADSSANAEMWYPKLTDFGMAKLLEHQGDVTRSGALVGTPAYMAPEQAQGRVHDLDWRTDVYGLGAILYECLTGQRVFETQSDVEALRRVLFEEPQCPRRLRPAIPRDLAAICLKCLEKSPTDRYASARELAEDLRRYLVGEPTLARPAGSIERLVKWSRRRPAIAALVGLSAISVIAIITLSGWSAVRMAHERDQTRLAQRRTDSLLYASNMSLASNALNVSHTEQAAEYLDQCVPGPDQEDHREFAWGYLSNSLHSECATLLGHQGAVFAVAFSVDGKRILSGGLDGKIRVWDVETHKQVDEFAGHQGDVNRLNVSPDGQFVASAGDDGYVRLWDMATGNLQHELVGDRMPVFCASFSPQGNLLVTAGEDKLIRVWNTSTWQPVYNFPTDIGIHTAVFSPDGKWLAVSGKADTLRVWNVETGEMSYENKRLLKPQGMVFSNDGKHLMFGGADGEGVRRIVTDELEPVKGWRLAEPFSVRKLIHLHQSQRLIVISGDAGWSLSDYPSRYCLKRCYGHLGRVYDADVRMSDDLVVTAGEDGAIKLWDLTDRSRTSSAEYKVGINHMALSKDGTMIGGASMSGLRVWSTADDTLLLEAPDVINANCSIAFSPDNRRVAIGQTSDRAKVWAIDQSRPPWITPFHKTPVVSVAFHPTESLLATAERTDWVHLWDLDKEQQIAEWNLHASIKHCCFVGDGKTFLIVLGSGAQRVDVATGEVVSSWKDPTATITRAAISRDETLFATFEKNSVIRIWDAQSLAPVRTMTLHNVQAENRGIAFHPNGYTLSTIDTRSLKMWDLRTGRCLINATHPTFEGCTNLHFAPAGDVLYVTNGEFLHRLRPSTPGSKR